MIEIVFRVVLAGVLAVAALSKLASPSSSRAALASFGFAEGPLRGLAWALLIVVELGLAAGVAMGWDPAAYGAAALMLLLAAVIAGALLRGRAGAPCACFGARSRVSGLGVARNVLLAAAFAAVSSVSSVELSTDQWLGIGLGLALASCAGLAVAVLALAREVGMLRLRLGSAGALEVAGEGPELGATAPELLARIPLAQARTALAVFTSEGCQMCRSLEPAIQSLAREPEIAVGVFDEVAEAGVWRGLGIPGSPFAIALDREGTVLAKGTFNNLAQLESVIATAERRRAGGIEAGGEADGGIREALDRVPAGA
ncbi:MAG: MauE/DoxX family redox-associated membrane protein [Solirubrobacterales bacterium]